MNEVFLNFPKRIFRFMQIVTQKSKFEFEKLFLRLSKDK